MNEARKAPESRVQIFIELYGFFLVIALAGGILLFSVGAHAQGMLEYGVAAGQSVHAARSLKDGAQKVDVDPVGSTSGSDSSGSLPVPQAPSAGSPPVTGAADAGPQKPGPGKPWATREFPWQGDDYRDCGLSCLYKKSNEASATETLFVILQIEALEKANKAGKLTEAVQRNLGDFCMAGAESEEACFKRYKRFQAVRLRKIQAAMIRNADMAARLEGNVAATDASKQSASFALPASENPMLKKPQTPYVPTFEDLQAQYQLEQQKLRYLGEAEYLSWARSIPPEPSKDDFVKYKQLPLDPERPDGEKRLVIDQSCDGICHDEEAYETERTRWENIRDAHRRELEQMVISHRPNRDRGEHMTEFSVGSETKAAFIAARGMVVDSVNETITGDDGSSPSLGVPGKSAPPVRKNRRRPASAGNPPKRGPMIYTGQERVKDVPAGPGAKDTFLSPVLPGLSAAIETIKID